MRRIIILVLAAASIIPIGVYAQTTDIKYYLITNLGNEFEIERPLASPKVVGQPYIDRQIAGGLIAHQGGDYRVVESGTLNDIIMTPDEVILIENWAQGKGPYPLYGDGPPNGEIWIDLVGEAAFVGEMTPSSPTWPMDASNIDIDVVGEDITYNVDDSTPGDTHITFTGTGRAYIKVDHLNDYTAINYICPYCDGKGDAYMGEIRTPRTELGQYVAGPYVFALPGDHVDGTAYLKTPTNPLPEVPRIPNDVAHLAMTDENWDE